MTLEPTPWPASKVQPSPSPPYMAYVLRSPAPVGPPRGATGPQKEGVASNTTEPTLRLKESKGVYEHFHSPSNDHNRFLSEAKDVDRYAYRDLPRMAPPPFDRSGRSSIRPQSAGPRTRSSRRSPTKERARHLDPATLVNRNVTATGAPCFAASVVLPADLEQGSPLYDVSTVGEQTWRAARVLPYEVPPSLLGHGEGGQRPFHQDYRHYKYFGFAGKGAKTSWACNPKHSESWVRTRPASATATLSGKPQPTMVARQPGQPLTPLEAKLVAAYPEHAYSAEAKKKAPREPEVLDPYIEYVSVVTRQPLDRKKEVRDKSRHDKARVTTYLQPVPGELTLVENPSPNHGSMSPFHQRYSHYRTHGFSGAGATSSWARNPKLAILHDGFAAR